jgi:hypothetical protein
VTPQAVLEVLAGRSRYAAVLGDGFALAAAMGDGAVGIVLGDLPYDSRTHNGAVTTDGANDSAPIDIDFAPLPPVSTFAPSLLRCSRRWVLCFCAVEQLGEYKAAAGDEYIRGGLWVRTNGNAQKSGDRPAQPAEGIAILHRAGRKKWNGHGRHARWEGPKCSDPTRKHPTKKPSWLMEALLRDFAEPGDVVFDPTMGEGTTGEACLRLGLQFIGCEIDPKYHAMAADRLARAERSGVQMTIPERPKKAKQEALFR